MPQTYEYKMVQIPPNIQVKAKEHKGNEAASYLESIANEYAKGGWEFQRVDTIGVAVAPGCSGGAKGQKESFSQFYVITFRKPV